MDTDIIRLAHRAIPVLIMVIAMKAAAIRGGIIGDIDAIGVIGIAILIAPPSRPLLSCEQD